MLMVDAVAAVTPQQVPTIAPGSAAPVLTLVLPLLA